MIDGSCTVSSSYSISTVSFVMGIIIGRCYSRGKSCIIKNCVNMANVSYSGKRGDYTAISGIVGTVGISNINYDGKVMNCVNYGTVRNTGSINIDFSFGGIVGEIYSYVNGNGDCMNNCINYGALIYKGTSAHYYVEGINGLNWGVPAINFVMNYI